MKMRIATLGAMLFTVLAIGSSGVRAETLNKDLYFTISDVEMFEVVDGHETYVDRLVPSEPVDFPKGKTPSPIPPPAGGLSDIVSIGEKIWAIIEANRPVVIQNYAAVSAVPAGVRSWEELEGWSEPNIRIYKLIYKNLYKMTVAEFEYRVIYTANGAYQGRGQYLSRVSVEPKTLNVAWGFKFNANGSIVNVTNVGTKEAPLAAMELNMNWSVESVVKHMQESVHYYIRGDGLFKNLSNGTMPAGSK